MSTEAAALEELQSAGLVFPDGSLTQRGEFEGNLADYQFSDQELTTFRDFYDRGLILEDLSQTEEGRIFGMSREEVLDEGEEAFARWYKLGGWEEHTDEIAMRDPETGERLPFIAGPTSKSVVGESIKGLATEVIPSAAKGAGLMARSMKPDFLSKIDDTLGKVTLFDVPILAPIYPPAAYGYVERKAREKAGLTLDEFNELADDLALATSGKLVSGMARNQVWLARGIELQEAFLAKKMMGDSEEAEDTYIKALFNFEKGLQEIEDLDAAEGMMMGQAFLDILKPFDGRTEDEKLAEIARVGELVRTKRERFDDDTLEEFEKHQDNLSQFVEISAPITPLASVGLRLGASTAKKGMKISKEIAKKQAQLSMTQRMIDKGAFATPYVRKGETVLPTGSQGLKTRAAKLTEEIGALNQKAGKIDAQTGVAGAVKDAARNAGYATRNWFAGTKMGQGLAVATRKAGELVDDSPRLAKGLRTVTQAGRYGGFAVAAGGGGLAMLGSGGAFAPIAGLAVGLGTLPARYNILRAAFLTMRDMGAEALRRKGSMPYWKRVAEDTSKNALARKGALAMDLFRVPARVASRGAEAAAKGIIAETPFSMIGGLHLGAEAWAADAISEGVVLGSPGIVRGMVYGAGGMPAVAKKAEFDKLAMADAAEMRRNLDGQAQQDAFDRLPRDIRRQLGVYSAVFPDIDWNLDTEGTDSSWDKNTGKLSIAVNSADPLGALIGHEVAHSLHDRGLADLVVEELVGDGGALRMTKEQYLRARKAEQDQARVNKKGEVVLPSEAEIVAERDARRTDEEGVIVIPTDPDEAGLGDTMPEVMPLTPEAQEFKRRYEERSGELLDEADLALEYFADTVGASLSRSRQKLQEYAQRNPIVRGLVDGVFNKFAFGREFLLRSGVMFDRYGNPIKGQGVLGVFQQSPSLSRVVETYLRENTGRLPENVPDSAAKRAQEKADILTTEEEQAAIEDNFVDYVTDKDGNVKFLPDGTPVGWDEETWKARQTAGKTIIQEIAEKYGVSGVIFKNGERSYRLTRTQWDEVLRKLSESGWYNRVQLKIFEQMIDAVQREDGDQFLLHYHPVYSTDKRGGKRVPRNGRFSKLKKGVPYDITVSSKGNMLFRVVDVDKLANNAEKAFNTKLGQQLYNNTRDIMNDLETLAKNHKAGKSNVDHFGSQDRVNFLNAIMGILNKEHEAKNPLFEQPVFRNFRNKTNATDSVRLDRINRARIGRTQALPFRFDEWRKNMMPGQPDATAVEETPAETTADDAATLIGPRDAEHAAAEAAGDFETGKRLRDEAAKEAGWDPGRFALDQEEGTNSLYHGTTQQFTAFSLAKANVEGNMGKGFYFSNTRIDAEKNYALPSGPDLRSKVDQLGEKMAHDLMDRSEEDLFAYAREHGFNADDLAQNISSLGKEDAVADLATFVAEKMLVGQDNKVIEADIRLEDPAILDDRGTDEASFIPMQPYFDEEAIADEMPRIRKELAEEQSIDPSEVEEFEVRERAEEWAGDNGYFNEQVHPAIDAVRRVAFRFDDVDAEKLDELRDLTYEDLSLAVLEKELRKGAFAYATDKDTGAFAAGEAIRQVFEELGYDGIVDKNAGAKFQMTNVRGFTQHIIAFRPEQIKLTDPFTYDNRGNLIPLSERFNPESSDIRYMPGRDPQTSTPEFRNFFNESKVTDANGDPLVVYHGSKSSDISEFDPGTYSYPDSLDSIGTWFTSAKNQAPRYAADATIYPSYLRIENPYVIKPAPDEPFKKLFAEWKEFHGGEQFGDSSKFVNHLRSKGHDGIILERTQADAGLEGDQVADWFIAFDPKQIKSATDNRGTFDPNDPDIRRMPGPAPKPLPDDNSPPEAFPVLYKVARNGRFKKKKGKLIPAPRPYRLTQGDFVEEDHGPAVDPNITFLDERHYKLTKPALKTLQQLAENGTIDHAARVLVEEAKLALKNPEIASGLGWYSRMRAKLAVALGDDFDVFTQLLGATSAQTPVETNFRYAVEALEILKRGDYDKNIEGYLKLREAVAEGIEATQALLDSEGIKHGAKPETIKSLATKYIKANDLSPRRESGGLYGANSEAVLKVLGGHWFQEASSPKTPQFAMNLYGTSLRATIDVWAARTLRRIFYRNSKQWRIQPKAEDGVNNLDFALGQLVFDRAAKQMDMNADDLQALVWFMEKDTWAKNGWTGEIGAFKGSFDEAAEVFFPGGKKRRELDHGRNIMAYLQKRRLVDFDKTLPPAKTKKDQRLRDSHVKELQEAIQQPGVSKWLLETGKT